MCRPQQQESSQASVQRCAQLEEARCELERQLSGLSDRLEEEESCSAQLALHRDRLQVECSSLRRHLDDLESALTAAEQDKQVKRSDEHSYGETGSKERDVMSIKGRLVVKTA